VSGCTLASASQGSGLACGPFYTLADTSGCNPDPNGNLPMAVCLQLCPSTWGGMAILASCSELPGGPPPELYCAYEPCGIGRRPDGLALCDARPARGGAGAVALYLAAMAWLEAASVPAFERLTRELAAHGAPRRLREASRRAAGEEVRHARRVRALAARAGAATAHAPRVDAGGPRSLEDIAFENAVEGCVRETFGAAVAAVQARRAGDARFRAAMKRIAREEERHARLSWKVASWLETRLDEGARQRVKAARDRAAEELLRETAAEPDPALVAQLGVPTSSEARKMVQSLRASLWA
jgi:hypothetical protein